MSATAEDNRPAWHSMVGIILAFISGIFIGSSFILQKMGQGQASQATTSANEYSYLKNRLWWVGIIFMIFGEICNFGAYAFAPAIIVTPLGAVSVVVSALLSVFLLKERLSFPASMGILLCIVGSVMIVLHAPSSTQTSTIPEFYSYVLTPGFLVYTFCIAVLVCFLVFKLGPMYGPKQPLVYLSVTSLGGAFLVNAAQGLGSSIVYSISYPEDTQFKYWGMYALVLFAILAAVFQINYLNKSLRFFSASVVTPVNYVFFSTATLITSAVLFNGMSVTALDASQVFLGFLVIIIGVSLIFQFHLKERVEKMRREAAAIDIQVTHSTLARNGSNSAVMDDANHLNVPLMEEVTVHDLDPVNLWFQTYPLDLEVHKRKAKSVNDLSMESGDSGEDVELGRMGRIRAESGTTVNATSSAPSHFLSPPTLPVESMTESLPSADSDVIVVVESA